MQPVCVIIKKKAASTVAAFVINFLIEKLLELLSFIWELLNMKVDIWIFIVISIVIIALIIIALIIIAGIIYYSINVTLKIGTEKTFARSMNCSGLNGISALSFISL